MKVDIINSTPNVAQVATGTLFETHGAYASAYTCTAYREMSFDKFVKEVVPTLKDNACCGKFFYYAIRDTSNDRFLCVQPDCVQEFKVDKVVQLPTDIALQELLKVSKQRQNKYEVRDLNCPLQVLYYNDNQSTISITFRVPSLRTLFSFVNNIFNIPIYFPELAFRVVIERGSKQPYKAYVSVIKEYSMDSSLIKYGDLALPNIYGDHSGFEICTGGAHFTTSSNLSKMSFVSIAYRVFELFCGSVFNHDLFNTSRLPSNLSEVYRDSIPTFSDGVKDMISKVLKTSGAPTCITYENVHTTLRDSGVSFTTGNVKNIYLAIFLACLSNKESCLKLDFIEIKDNVKNFFLGV